MEIGETDLNRSLLHHWVIALSRCNAGLIACLAGTCFVLSLNRIPKHTLLQNSACAALLFHDQSVFQLRHQNKAHCRRGVNPGGRISEVALSSKA